MHRVRTTTIYSAAHFAVDFACAWMVWRHVPGSGSTAAALFLYNFCAFALQMPLGVAADRIGGGRGMSAAGCVLVAASAFPGIPPLLMCVAAGVGNAMFHAGGGWDVLNISGSRAGLTGVFVSPGAFGLFTGALLCGHEGLRPVCAAVLLLCAAAILRFCTGGAAPEEGKAPRAGGRLLWLVPVFLVVCLRSCGGFLFAFPWKTGAWSWVFAVCVVLGKAAGGFLYDRFGGVRTSAATLAAGAALFALSDSPAAGCAAVLLFNMTMPVTLRAAADLLHPRRGFAFGLLSFALFAGFLPVWAGAPLPGGKAVYAGLCLATLALLVPALRRKET